MSRTVQFAECFGFLNGFSKQHRTNETVNRQRGYYSPVVECSVHSVSVFPFINYLLLLPILPVCNIGHSESRYWTSLYPEQNRYQLHTKHCGDTAL